jgi:hypothetical protein
METCSICGWPVSPAEVTFDDQGKAYHEECLDENYEPDEADFDWEDEEQHEHPR